MKPTFNQVSEILKTLPISYYLKRKARIKLSKEEENSFIDLVSGDIVISFNQIEKTEFFSDKELEKDIRTNLYHEVSHAILSPRPKKLIIDKEIFNCFEDERIENLLENYFLDVDFKSYLKKLHKSFSVITPFDYFFYCIRLRGGGYGINSLINSLILKWKHLKFNIKPQNLKEYQEDINNLYKTILQQYEEKDFWQIEDEKIISSMIVPPEARIDEFEMEKLSEEIQNSLNVYQDKEFRRQAELIINSRNSERSNNSESKNTYSGKINPKLIGKPNDDYKWFLKKGDGLYQYNKGLKLNLFIDQSGSYQELELQTNSVLRELSFLESKVKDFKFDLIVLDTNVELKSKYHRMLECNGGNCLRSELKDYYYKVQSPNSKNINLVLFNGDMATSSYTKDGISINAFSEEQYANLKVFNNKSTIIISDHANTKALLTYCKKTKIIYTKNYLEELKKYILKSLKILIK